MSCSRRGWKRIRSAAPAGALAAALLGALLGWPATHVAVHAQDGGQPGSAPGIVQPGDVATPTPTAPPVTPAPPPAILLPTVTPSAGQGVGAPAQAPQPQPPSSGVSDMPAVHTGDGEPRSYKVRAGDTLFTVALETGLDLDDVPCTLAPDFTVDRPLVIGDVLSVPPANITCHTVQTGDTLASIAAQYGSSAEQIYLLPWNRLTEMPLEQVTLTPGLHLRVPLPLPEVWTPDKAVTGSAVSTPAPHQAFLPQMLNMPVNTSPFAVLGNSNARRPAKQVTGPIPADWPYGSGHFTWPVYGWLSQGYRYDHRAIDIAAVQGTPVTASDRGVVVRAGWNDQGYGRFVVIDHQIDFVTLYAHLDRILVKEGDVVGQGQVIGTVGSTGNSTGPHLHFEIRDFGRRSNPLELLAAN